MRHSEALKTRIDLVLPGFFALTERLWRSPDLSRRYPRYLCTMHALIRATVPLMEAALEVAGRRAADDPVSHAMIGYLRKHIREEHGHDEWVREDLAAIGADPDEPWTRMPSPAIAALVGAQYYWIRHHHPVCLLGHIAVFEGYPPSPALADTIVERTGYPRSGLRTLIRHTALDQRHGAELATVIDALPLAPEHLDMIGLSALSTIDGLFPVFADLVADIPAPDRAAAMATGGLR